ncbi:MAG: peptide chain release factor N(5)-glutamine methyltransferase [Bacteroidota bacterium]
MTSKHLYQKIYRKLIPAIQQKRTCHAITQQLLAHYLQLDAISIVLDEAYTLSPTNRKLLSEAIARLKKQEPIQYIIGSAPFLDSYFTVSPAVLIPRPETEAFVQYIIDKNPQVGLRVLDIGTGSGCIAITLQKALSQATVHALDVDREALRIAQINAQQLNAKVRFIQADILQASLPNQCWDIIVSNPPYVRLAERTQMQRRVLDYEPAKALFVPDENPLIFYKRIVALSTQHLTPKGKLYVEINEALGKAVAHLFIDAGFEEICIRQDLHNKDRWVAGVWPG